MVKMEISKLARQKRFTESEKDFLRSEAARLGITFRERMRCQMCFSDLAIQLYSVLHRCKVKADTNVNEYRLKEGVNVTFVNSNVTINEATFTQEMGRMLVEKGLTKYLQSWKK
jgi:hypothetical protein